MKLIFGREPAMIVAALNALLAVLVATHVLTWTTDQTAVVMAFVAAGLGVLASWAVQTTRLALILSFVKAGLILAIGFGLSLSADTLGVIMTAVSLALGLVLRDRTSPIPEIDPAVPGPDPIEGRHAAPPDTVAA